MFCEIALKMANNEGKVGAEVMDFVNEHNGKFML